MFNYHSNCQPEFGRCTNLFHLHLFFYKGADIIGVNCLFEPEICLRTVQIMKDALNASGMLRPLMVQPIAYKTPDADRRGMVALPESPLGK